MPTIDVQPSGTPVVVNPPSARAHGEHKHLDLSRIAQDLQIRKTQVENVVQLLDEGNTIPFITRYRKERTGGLNEDLLRIIQERVHLLRQLAERKQTILRSIENQGKLTPELRSAILSADNPRRLEDLYLPYKPKKRSLATAAREKGLEPLALAIWHSDPAVSSLPEILTGMVNPEKELATPEQVLEGVRHILAEIIAESADVRSAVRNVLWDTGKLCTTKSEKLAEGQGLEYKDYFQFTEPVRHIPPHRILAINRGEKENALQVKLEWDAELGLRIALERLPLPVPGSPPPLPEAPAPPVAPSQAEAVPNAIPNGSGEAPIAPTGETPVPPSSAIGEAPVPPESPASTGEAPVPPASLSTPPAPPRVAITPMPHRAEALQKHPHADFLREVTLDALTRLLVPSLEREIRRELKMRAENHAVEVFARNLRSKLLAAPLRGRRVLAIDPGFRTGCKLALLDEIGNLLEEGVIYPHTGNKRDEAKAKLEQVVRKYQVQVIAIGNGTACRETEELISELIAELDARRRGEPPPTPPVADAPGSPPVVEAAPPAPVEASAAETQSEPGPQPEAQARADSAPAEPVPQPEAQATVDSPSLGPPASEPAPAETTPQAVEAAPAPAPVEPPPPAEPLPEALPELAYVIVNEAGASVYSTSPIGKEEFPGLDASLRGTISIGRRLQDPLSELVKIDPQHVGVGLYQHDVPARELRESLDGVVESCVNQVGVDLNTASVPLLRHVSGLNQLVARDLVEHRKNNGPFRDRRQLLQINGIGEQRFIQAAGFLKIGDGDNPLDSTWIHPESYGVAEQILKDLGYVPESLRDPERLAELREKLKAISPEEVAKRLHTGVPTVKDILEALARPGRDPREDLPPPVFKKNILKIEDLQPGMELKGTVLNVVDFGAFIDIGLKDSGLVHISQMANRYVKSTYDVVAVGDVVTVWVLSVDKERHRVSLTMIAPGTQRKPPEKKPEPRERRDDRHDRPPRGERPPRREGGERREGPAGGRPPQQRGRRPLPPRGGRSPVAQGAPGGAAPAQGGASRAPAPPPGQQQPPPRKPKPRRQPPKPKLSQAALAGATPLGTFAELAAFWEAKKKEEPQPVPPAPPTDGSSEQPTPEG
ncbi:MAG TPA: Tex-like N-terminal domain-containing protein [Gemmataceae bacterium]|nr:Tex-like N-terminal domain-containing protein [Gemmataceae bacterium]